MTDLRIDRVELALLDLPLRRPHRFARVGMDAQPVLLVFLRTDRYLAPLLIGRRVDNLAGIGRDLDDVVANNLYAKAAVEVALHDAWARCLGVPVHTLLGGLARRSVPVTWALGTDPAPTVIEEALGKLWTRGTARSSSRWAPRTRPTTWRAWWPSRRSSPGRPACGWT